MFTRRLFDTVASASARQPKPQPLRTLPKADNVVVLAAYRLPARPAPKRLA